VCPSVKALATIKARITQQTARRLTPIALEEIVRNVNASLRGWVGYFHYRNSSAALSKVKQHAEERLRKHLRKRHKVKDRGTGYQRFPGALLYSRHGLYKVPTRAAWKTAHASV